MVKGRFNIPLLVHTFELSIDQQTTTLQLNKEKTADLSGENGEKERKKL